MYVFNYLFLANPKGPKTKKSLANKKIANEERKKFRTTIAGSNF